MTTEKIYSLLKEHGSDDRRWEVKELIKKDGYTEFKITFVIQHIIDKEPDPRIANEDKFGTSSEVIRILADETEVDGENKIMDFIEEVNQFPLITNY